MNLKEEIKMETTLLIINAVLIWCVIYQSLKIKKLRKQTIEAFRRICLKIFKEESVNKN